MAAGAVPVDAPALPRGGRLLWAALAAGPAAAALNEGIGYALVKPACAAGGVSSIVVLAAACAVVALAGAWIGLQHYLDARASRDTDQPWTRGSRQFLALTAIGLDLLVVLFILNSFLPMLVLSPCE
jgi:hypothetical protein